MSRLRAHASGRTKISAARSTGLNRGRLYLGFEDSPQARLEPPPSEVVKTKSEVCDVFILPKLCKENKNLPTCCTKAEINAVFVSLGVLRGYSFLLCWI